MTRWLFIFFFVLAVSVQADSVVVSGETDVEDTYIYSLDTDVNYGTEDTLISQQQFSILRHAVLACLNLENYITWPGEYAIAGSLFVFRYNVGAGVNVNLHAVCKPLYETDATYNDWHSPDSEWTTAGIGDACDPCTYNHSDGSGCDRTSTAVDGPNSVVGGTWGGFEIDTSYFNGYLRDDHDQLVFRMSTPTNITTARFYSTEFDGLVYTLTDSTGALGDIENDILGVKVYIPFGCSVDSMQALVVSRDSDKDSKGVVWSFTSGDDSDLVAESGVKSAFQDSAWVSYVFGGEGLAGNKFYLFAVWGDDGAGLHFMKYKSSGGFGIWHHSETYGDATPDPYTTPGVIDDNGLLPLRIFVTDSSDHTPYFIVYYPPAVGEINAIHEVGAGGVVHGVGTAGSAIHE